MNIGKSIRNTVLASTVISQYQFLGAKKLLDAGSSATGRNLELIMMDPDHHHHHLAETQFDALMDDFGIADDEKGPKFQRWNTPDLTSWNTGMIITTISFWH